MIAGRHSAGKRKIIIIKKMADKIVDTTSINVHQLKI